MKSRPSQLFRYVLIGLTLINFLITGLTIDLNHDHEIDFLAHRDCPACQWELLAKDTDSDTSCSMQAINLALIPSDTYSSLEILSHKTQIVLNNTPSRAPPLSS